MQLNQEQHRGSVMDSKLTEARRMVRFYLGMEIPGRREFFREWMLSYFLEKSRMEKVRSSTPALEKRKCINNSIKVLGIKPGSMYVEGFCIGAFPFVHAWNARDGEWIDHTIRDASKFLYLGMEIPSDLVIAAALDEAWTLSVGVIQTLMMTKDESLVGFAAETFGLADQ